MRNLSRAVRWFSVLALVVSGELDFCGGFVPKAEVAGLKKQPFRERSRLGALRGFIAPPPCTAVLGLGAND